MIQSDKKRFVFIMAGMADNFRDSISKEGMRMRFEMLKAYSIEQVEAAAKAIMARRKYTKMPPIAEFIEELKPKEPQLEDRALVMATRIIDHLHRHGASLTPDLSDDPIAERLMRSRWPYWSWAASLIQSEEKWWVKEFCAAYCAQTNIDQVAIEGPARFKQLAGSIAKDLPN